MVLCVILLWCLFLGLSGAQLGGVGAAIWVLVSSVGFVGGFDSVNWEVWAVLGVVYISGMVAMALYVGSSDLCGFTLLPALTSVCGGFVVYTLSNFLVIKEPCSSLYTGQTSVVLILLAVLLLVMMCFSSQVLGAQGGSVRCFKYLPGLEMSILVWGKCGISVFFCWYSSLSNAILSGCSCSGRSGWGW